MVHALLDAERKKSKESQSEVDKLLHDKKMQEMEMKTYEDTNSKLKKEMEKLIDTDRIQRGLLENEIKDMRNTVHEQREKINSQDAEILENQRKKPEVASEEELERLRQDNNNLLDELRQNMEELLKLEELEAIKPQLIETKKENARLREEIDSLKGRAGDRDVEIKSDDDRIEHLQEGLLKAGSHQDKLSAKIESLGREKKELIEKMKKKDLMIEDKEKQVVKALESLEQVKETGKKTRIQVEKLAKEKEDVAKKLDRVLNDFSALKKAKEELQTTLEGMKDQYQGFIKTISKKDEWILRQGGEMKVVAEQYANLKKKHTDYRLEIEMEYGKVLSDKNTEILVLREMIKSTKSMVRAKDVDLARLKRRAQQSDSQTPVFDEDRSTIAAPKGFIGRKPLPNAKLLNGLKSPTTVKLRAKGRHAEPDSADEDNPERPVA